MNIIMRNNPIAKNINASQTMKATTIVLFFVFLCMPQAQAQDSIPYHIEYKATGGVQAGYDSIVEVFLVIDETDLGQIENTEVSFFNKGGLKKTKAFKTEELKQKSRYKYVEEPPGTLTKGVALQISLDTLPLSEAYEPQIKFFRKEKELTGKKQ